jgi:hypothetical protein
MPATSTLAGLVSGPLRVQWGFQSPPRTIASYASASKHRTKSGPLRGVPAEWGLAEWGLPEWSKRER